MELNPQIVRWLTSLRVNKYKGEPRPLKPVMLLAVLELAETGRLGSNEIYFDPTLFEYFEDYWRAVTDEPPARIQYPYWHLDSEPFWELVLYPAYADKTSRKKKSPSAKQIRDWVRYARLAPVLFEAMADEAARDQMRGVLVSEHFPERADRVAEIREFENSVFRYTQLIRRVSEPNARYNVAPEFVRDAAFRRVVTEAYNYTCAVSGLRLSLWSGGTYQVVQAAHIHDWSVSHDDSPRNGITLSPNHHWLFERGLFTLDRQWRVKVSSVARDCAGTVEELLTQHHGQRIRLPEDESLWPGQDYLSWHRETKYLRR